MANNGELSADGAPTADAGDAAAAARLRTSFHIVASQLDALQLEVPLAIQTVKLEIEELKKSQLQLSTKMEDVFGMLDRFSIAMNNLDLNTRKRIRNSAANEDSNIAWLKNFEGMMPVDRPRTKSDFRQLQRPQLLQLLQFYGRTTTGDDKTLKRRLGKFLGFV